MGPEPHTRRAGESFPATRATLVAGLRSREGGVRDAAWNRLVAGYWRPVYKYLRLRWRCEPSDAEDLTQGFFTSLLERGSLASFDPERARLRTFLRVCLDRLVGDRREHDARQRRGGGAPHLSLDFTAVEREVADLPAVAETEAEVERFFRREWLRSLLGLAAERLRAELVAAGKAQRWHVFARYDLADASDAERPTYAQLADELEVPETRVTN
jgi:RNA polymerase sigma factor (sigma-70 family)